MGIFSKDAKPHGDALDLDGAFAFRVSDVFTVTGKGRMFTGVVESGSVRVNAPAVLHFADCRVVGVVKRLETRKRRRPSVLCAGETGAIALDGVSTDDLPLRAYGGLMIVDSDALVGAVIKSPDSSTTSTDTTT